MLALGVCEDDIDNYDWTNESTTIEYLNQFYQVVWAMFGKYHLQQSIRDDFELKLSINAALWFLSMFEFLDCMHYDWKNCLIV